jgi:hypothetical protein
MQSTQISLLNREQVKVGEAEREMRTLIKGEKILSPQPGHFCQYFHLTPFQPQKPASAQQTASKQALRPLILVVPSTCNLNLHTFTQMFPWYHSKSLPGSLLHNPALTTYSYYLNIICWNLIFKNEGTCPVSLLLTLKALKSRLNDFLKKTCR